MSTVLRPSGRLSGLFAMASSLLSTRDLDASAPAVTSIDRTPDGMPEPTKDNPIVSQTIPRGIERALAGEFGERAKRMVERQIAKEKRGGDARALAEAKRARKANKRAADLEEQRRAMFRREQDLCAANPLAWPPSCSVDQ